jgi:DNA-binding MurR/RpiR family transcriptional regulator
MSLAHGVAGAAEGVADGESVVDRVLRSYQRMTPAERALADLLITQPERVVQMTIGEIAGAAGVGTSVVSRFGQRIGMDGFRLVRIALARELGAAATAKPASTAEGGTSGDADPIWAAASASIDEAVAALELNKRSLDRAALRAAARLVLEANHVVSVGYGTSAAVAQRLASMLRRHGWRARAEAEPINDAWRADLDAGDLVIAITHRGRVPRMIAALPDIQARGARLVAVTNSADSAVGRAADVVVATCVLGGDSDAAYLFGPVFAVQLTTVRAFVEAALAARDAVSATSNIEPAVGQESAR